MKTHSQFGEDLWIVRNAPFDLAQGTFCEVGAYNGIASSNTLAFEEIGWTGLCVEPDPRTFPECVNNRRCPTVCLVASNRVGPVDFFLHQEDKGQSGLKAKGRKIQHFAVRLETLLYAFGLQDLTLLSIDTEGTELDVWKGLSAIRPAIVIIEFLSGDGIDRSAEIVQRLTRYLYRQVHRTEANLIFYRFGL